MPTWRGFVGYNGNSFIAFSSDTIALKFIEQRRFNFE